MGFWADPAEDVLGKDTVEEMCQPQTMSDLETWQLAWGLGVMLLRTKDTFLVGHTGGMPGHISGCFVHRDSGTAGIALMNTTSAPDPAGLAVELANYAIENEPAEPETWTPGTEVPEELRGVLGHWYAEGQLYTFSVLKGQLQARGAAAPASKPPSIFVKLAEDLYRTESGPRDRRAATGDARLGRERHAAALGDLPLHPGTAGVRRVAAGLNDSTLLPAPAS